MEPLAGYMSLHQSVDGGVSLQWTPNQLMNRSCDDNEGSVDRRCPHCFCQSCYSVVSLASENVVHFVSVQ